MDEARERLTREMDARRKTLRLRWNAVADRAGMSPQNLLRIRTGAIALTDFAVVGLEQALEWPSGHIADLLAEDPASEPDLDERQTAILREKFEEWRREYGRKRALAMIDEVLRDWRDEQPSEEDRPRQRDIG